MSARNRVPIVLKFNDGSKLSAWTRFQWRDDFTDPLGSLDVETRPPVAQRARYRQLLAKGRLVALYLNDVRQATMLIVGNPRRIGAGYTISAQCKGVLATAYEGSADPYLAQSFDADTKVSSAVLAALEAYGFDTISVAAAANVSAMTGKGLSGQAPNANIDELKHKDVQVQPNETAYAFAARMFTRLGLLLHNDVNGLLLLRKPDYDQKPCATLVSPGTANVSGDRFLAEPELMIDDTNEGQFSEVVVIGKEPDKAGQKSATAPTTGIAIEGSSRPPGAPFENVALTTIPAGRHTYRSEGGAAYKPKFRFDKKARDKKWALNMATIMHGARSSQAFQVHGTVDGFLSTTGCIWTSGTVVRVVIAEEEIDESMFVLANTKTAGEQGQRTELTLIPLGSLVLGQD